MTHTKGMALPSEPCNQLRDAPVTHRLNVSADASDWRAVEVALSASGSSRKALPFGVLGA